MLVKNGNGMLCAAVMAMMTISGNHQGYYLGKGIVCVCMGSEKDIRAGFWADGCMGHGDVLLSMSRLTLSHMMWYWIQGCN